MRDEGACLGAAACRPAEAGDWVPAAQPRRTQYEGATGLAGAGAWEAAGCWAEARGTSQGSRRSRKKETRCAPPWPCWQELRLEGGAQQRLVSRPSKARADGGKNPPARERRRQRSHRRRGHAAEDCVALSSPTCPQRGIRLDPSGRERFVEVLRGRQAQHQCDLMALGPDGILRRRRRRQMQAPVGELAHRPGPVPRTETNAVGSIHRREGIASGATRALLTFVSLPAGKASAGGWHP